MKTIITTIEPEFVFYPFQGGVKFVRPEAGITGHKWQDLMSLSTDVCLISRDVKAISMNDPAVIRTGMESFKDCYGKTIFDVADAETAYTVTQQQQKTFKEKSMQIMEYDFRNHDELVHRCLLFSMRWYQENNDLGGILDLAVVSGRDPIPVALGNLMRLGLLGPSTYNVVDDEWSKLSKREKECVKLLSEGNKSKQIAIILNLSPRTVDHYLESCMTKLNVSSRYALITKYIKSR